MKHQLRSSKRLALGSMSALFWVLISIQGVSAKEIVTTNAVPPQLTDWSSIIQVDKFDPAQGILLRVDAVIQGDLLGTARYESLDSLPTDMTVEMSADTELRWPDGPVIIAAFPAASRTQPATEFDGEVDFAGTSGATLEGIIGFDVSKTATFSQTEELQRFIGVGPSDFQVDTSGRSRAQGAGNLAARFTLTTSAQITITYTYGNPAIDIEKQTNGEDADEPTGPHIAAGDPVTWTYVVTNTGDVKLVDVVVSDDRGVAVSCPQTALEPAETMLCMAHGIAITGQYSNTGTVVGQPVDLVNSPRGATVSDSDKSHYYGDPGSGDFCAVNVLPDVIYLGESSGAPAATFVLPAGYDSFIVKRRKPFLFINPTPETNALGQQIYNARTGHIERVWACSGNCTFHETLQAELSLGFQKTGTHLELLIIDDDNDNRWDWWAANDPLVPYQRIDIQSMVEITKFDVPFDADWYFYTQDSIGIVSICIIEPPALAADIHTAAPALETPQDAIHGIFGTQTFLPIVNGEGKQ
ncbi:MAG: choice-of-anchor E domain-containing protein [Caldilineaceae bacterium]